MLSKKSSPILADSSPLTVQGIPSSERKKVIKVTVRTHLMKNMPSVIQIHTPLKIRMASCMSYQWVI